MASRKRRSAARFRIGKVSGYSHHGAWWLYYRESGRPVRRKVSQDRAEAARFACQIHAQLASESPTLLSFNPTSIPELRQEFLDYHEHVLRSSIATVRRYRAATQHLENFTTLHPWQRKAHEVQPAAFAAYLRKLEVSPNGHYATARRHLRDKGVQFILETCRSLYNFAYKRRHLPPYANNLFSELPLDRFKIEDSKPIFVFDAATELAFFQAASDWAFPLHFTLAKTGLRIGEATHLLIEEVDLTGGWLQVRNKPGLGWRVKTGQERQVPLLPEVVAVLRRVIGTRRAGPVFLRERLQYEAPEVVTDRAGLAELAAGLRRAAGGALSRSENQRLAQQAWRRAGAARSDAVRQSFVKIMRTLGRPEVTCPKSWRHTFATLLQDANVDPLIRQQVMGHKPSDGTGLGMTATYTHTRGETMRAQIGLALNLWPASLALATKRVSQSR